MRVLLWVALLGSLWQGAHCQPAVVSSRTPSTSFYDASKAPAPGLRADGQPVFTCSLDTNPSGLRRQTVGQPLVLTAVPTVTWTGPQGGPITQPVIGAVISFYGRSGPATPDPSQPSVVATLGTFLTTLETKGQASMNYSQNAVGTVAISAAATIAGRTLPCTLPMDGAESFEVAWVPPVFTVTAKSQTLTVGETANVQFRVEDAAGNGLVRAPTRLSATGVGRMLMIVVSADPGSVTPAVRNLPAQSTQLIARHVRGAGIKGFESPWVYFGATGSAAMSFTSNEPGMTTISLSTTIGNAPSTVNYTSDPLTITWVTQQ